MRREVKKYLFDMQQAVMLLTSFTHGKSFADFTADALLRSGVERQFEIVGEALTHLAKEDAEVAGSISDFRRIIAFRNILIHGYADVDHRLVWDVVETKLPVLEAQLHELLAED